MTRLSAALAVSLAAHAAAAWGLDSLLRRPGQGAGIEEVPSLRARLSPTNPTMAQAPAAPAAPRRGTATGRYVNAAELDVRPQIMTHVMPEYPPEMLSGTKGRVVLRLYIGSDGLLDDVRVAPGRPAGLFDRAAVRAFAGARFTPGMKAGKPVACLLLIEVNFGD